MSLILAESQVLRLIVRSGLCSSCRSQKPGPLEVVLVASGAVLWSGKDWEGLRKVADIYLARRTRSKRQSRDRPLRKDSEVTGQTLL